MVFGRLLMIMVAVRLGAGCSWVFIEQAPPPDKRGPYFYCHKSKAIPTVDGLVASLFAINGAIALSRDESDYAGKTLSQGSDAVLNFVLAALWMISSASGVMSVDECRAASEANRVVAPSAAARKPVVVPGPIVAPVDPEPIVAPVDPEPIVAPVDPEPIVAPVAP
jgi:hypothetical protein